MRRILIANRGEIAVRIVRACFDEGIESVLAVSAADKDSLAAKLADRVIVIGPPSAGDSYLAIERIVSAALVTECDAIHPGYGFLSERAELVDACEQNGLIFIGPPASVMRSSGGKLSARAGAAALGIPTGRGTDGLTTLSNAIETAEQLNDYPLLLKASAGGGGRGMTIIRGVEDLQANFERSCAEAESAFGDGTLYLEPYIEYARHIEVQILADSHGNVVHLGERDCSTQRRYQKIIEEAPAVGLAESLVASIREAAVTLARHLSYVGAGTVEFLVDVQNQRFVFLEINARVQVEHPVTEMLTGIDIVRQQINIARGAKLSFTQSDIVLSGHVIECRINAEDPDRGFAPSPGTVDEWFVPSGEGVRIDTYMLSGAKVPPYYDSLIAKLLVHAPDRPAAIEKMLRVLDKMTVRGIATTIALQKRILSHTDFAGSPVTTKWLEDVFFASAPTPDQQR